MNSTNLIIPIDSRTGKGWISLFEAIPDAATITTCETGRILMANKAAENIYGFTQPEMIGKTTVEIGLFQNREIRDKLVSLLDSKSNIVEGPFWKAAKEKCIAMYSARRVYFQEQECLLIIARDITANKMQEQALRESEARYRMLAEATMDVPWQVDPDGKLIYIGPGIAKYGYNSELLIGKSFYELISRDDHRFLKDKFQEASFDGVVYDYLHVHFRKQDGDFVDLELNIATVRNAFNDIIGFHGMSRDISKRIEMENQLKSLAFKDDLTGLLNRRSFLDRLRNIINVSSFAEYGICLLYIDIDDFKLINDQYGHDVGDVCLQNVAKYLNTAIRSNDYVARLGGDEFAALLTNVNMASAIKITERFLALLAEMNLGMSNQSLRINTSIGICFATKGMSAEQLITFADAAMYKAKKAGKNNFSVYNDSHF